ncbi:hypothetical protein BJP32_06225 [Brevundimonas sp. ZS04]|nr:hypothetical protein BJP32_06225 [Brevundimonas sp. ZS04]
MMKAVRQGGAEAIEAAQNRLDRCSFGLLFLKLPLRTIIGCRMRHEECTLVRVHVTVPDILP